MSTLISYREQVVAEHGWPQLFIPLSAMS